jgi:hypothetical protein
LDTPPRRAPGGEGHMAIQIQRREFIAALGGAAACPLGAWAQQPGGMRRIGVLMSLAEDDRQGQANPQASAARSARPSWPLQPRIVG